MSKAPPRPARTKAVIEEELAACLSIIAGIPHEHQLLMTAQQVRSLFQFDHAVHHAIGGQVVHYNLTPRLILDHRGKTNKIDKPQIAKTKRIAPEHEAFRRRLLAKAGQNDPSEPVPSKPKSKMRSRGFAKFPKGILQSRGHRKFNGEIVWR